MVDGCQEPYLRRLKWVPFRHNDLQLEDTPGIRRVGLPQNRLELQTTLIKHKFTTKILLSPPLAALSNHRRRMKCLAAAQTAVPAAPAQAVHAVACCVSIWLKYAPTKYFSLDSSQISRATSYTRITPNQASESSMSTTGGGGRSSRSMEACGPASSRAMSSGGGGRSSSDDGRMTGRLVRTGLGGARGGAC